MLTRLEHALSAIIVLNSFVFLLPGGYSPEIKSLLWVASIGILFQSIYTSGNAYFQYSMNYWRSTISVILGTIVTTILTLYYLSSSPTLPSLTLSITFGYFVMAVSTFLLLPRLLFKDIQIRDLREVAPTLLRASTLGAILIFSILSSKVDTILLGVFRTSREDGQKALA